MTDSTVLQRGLEGQRIHIKDLMDGEADVARDPDRLCDVAKSMSVSVNVLVSVIVVVLVTVTVMIR